MWSYLLANMGIQKWLFGTSESMHSCHKWLFDKRPFLKRPFEFQGLSSEIAREVNSRSSGWKIATFRYESVSRIEETCSEQLAERTCLENLLRGNRADNLLRATCTENLLEELAQRNSRNNLLRRATARRTARIARRICRRCKCFRVAHLLVFFFFLRPWAASCLGSWGWGKLGTSCLGGVGSRIGLVSWEWGRVYRI